MTRWVFVPYGAPVSTPLTQQLETTVARARKAGYPIKVAIIASPYDLGAVSSLYRKPQEYAKFLGSELTFLYRGRLLIVMPQGYGYYDGRGRRGPELSVLRGLKTEKGSDRLVAAATQAVAQLARARARPSRHGAGGRLQAKRARPGAAADRRARGGGDPRVRTRARGVAEARDNASR